MKTSGSPRATSTSGTWTPVVASLLPTLSVRLPGWVVLKNHERLPEVSGDIDTCLDRHRWDDFTRTLADVVRSWGPHAIVACDHYVGVRLLFVASMVSGDRTARCLEIDLADGIWWRGTHLAPASAIAAFAVPDRRGFLRTTDGWEAAVVLTLSGLGRTGALRESTVRSRRVRERASGDRAGFVAAMAALHGRAGAVGAERFLEDRWGVSTGLGLVLHRMGADPLDGPSRAVAFARRKAMSHWRGLPRTVGDDPERWLRRVARGHASLEVQP